MKKETIKALNNAYKQIEKSKTIIGKERDKLRALVDSIEEILEPVNAADENLEASLQELKSGIDSLSEQM